MSTTGAKHRSKQTEQGIPASTSEQAPTLKINKAVPPTQSDQKLNSEALQPKSKDPRLKETEQPQISSNPQTEKAKDKTTLKAVAGNADEESSEVSSASSSSIVAVPSHETPSSTSSSSEQPNKGQLNRKRTKLLQKKTSGKAKIIKQLRQKDTEQPSSISTSTVNAAPPEATKSNKNKSSPRPFVIEPISEEDIVEAANNLNQLKIRENEQAQVLEIQARQVRRIDSKITNVQRKLAQGQVAMHETEACCYFSCFKPQHPPVSADDAINLDSTEEAIELQQTYTPGRDGKRADLAKMKSDARKLVEQQKREEKELTTENKILKETNDKAAVAADQTADIIETGQRIINKSYKVR